MRTVMVLMTVLMTGCAGSNEPALTKLAARLVDDSQSVGWPAGLRETYINCGKTALAHVPATTLEKALRSGDSPAIWALLGSDALDRYVATCRRAEQTIIGIKP